MQWRTLAGRGGRGRGAHRDRSMSIATWSDLFLTSEGCVQLTIYGLLIFVTFCLFGPAPVDERQLECEREWASHEARGPMFQKRGDFQKPE